MRKKYEELYKQSNRERINFNNLLISIMGMFTYHGLPEEWRFPQDIERILCLVGRIGFAKDGNGKYYFPMSWSGKVAWDGRGSKYMGVVQGSNRNFEILSDEGAWGYNNCLGYADLEIKRYADLMAQVDLSAYRNVQFARLNPILGAKNDTVKAKLKDLFEDIMDGKLTTVVNDNVIRDFEQKLIEVYNITDVKDIDKLQYLSKFYEDIERRFFNLYGVPIQTTNKMAQVNTAEVHSHDKQASIIALDRLKCRQEMCERLSAYFDMPITVEFSLPWRWILEQENKEMEDNEDDGTSDNIEGLDNKPDPGNENDNDIE